MKPFSCCCLLCLAAFASALRADPLDDLIASASRGGPPAAQQEQVVNRSMASSSAAFRAALADAYLTQVKASILNPERHGGWPCRSTLIYSVTERRALTPVLKARFEQGPEPILAYALICPAIYDRDEALMNRALDYLQKKNPFLHQRAQAEMGRFWLPFISEALRKQTPAKTAREAKDSKDDPFSVLPR